jgi:tetratricopeptide (TPR) repeat protein
LPDGWPKPLADRARALILNRMSGLAADLERQANDPDPFDIDLGGFFGAPTRKKAAKKKPVDPTVFLKRAIELAPDWEPPTRELFQRAIRLGQATDAETVARKYLAHNPQSVYFLNVLATLLLRQGRAAEGLDLRVKALALNPLDAMARHYAAAAHVAHARRLGIDGKPADAQAALNAKHDLVFAEMKPSYHALRSTLFRKLGDKAKADEQADAGLAIPGARLTVRLYLHANAVLLKLRPADKTAASKAFTAALAEQPHPKEANMLVAGWDVFHNEGLTYTGQKTQEKKIYDAMVRAADGDGPEVEFEGLTVILNSRKQHTLVKKLAPKLMKRFPKNPVFPFCLGEAEAVKSRGGYRVTEPLRKAKVLAEASPEERHKKMLPRIEELLREMNPFGTLFSGFFGGEEF